MCYICGSGETYIDSEGREHWAYHRGERGKWTGNWLCNTCRNATDDAKKYYKKRYDEIKDLGSIPGLAVNIIVKKEKG